MKQTATMDDILEVVNKTIDEANEKYSDILFYAVFIDYLYPTEINIRYRNLHELTSDETDEVIERILQLVSYGIICLESNGDIFPDFCPWEIDYDYDNEYQFVDFMWLLEAKYMELADSALKIPHRGVTHSLLSKLFDFVVLCISFLLQHWMV